jgi:hypothetical protein
VYPDEELSESSSSRSSRASPRSDVEAEVDPSSQNIAFEGELRVS